MPLSSLTRPSPSRLSPEHAAGRPLAVLLVIPPRDREAYTGGPPTTFAVHATHEAMQRIEDIRPHVVVIDWDYQGVDTAAVCRAAAARSSTLVMITTESTARVPAALKAGCKAVLLKPFAPNLLAARLGRLCRDATTTMAPAYRALVERGTNRTWPDTHCPECSAGSAVSFDHASYRRSWYACLTCEHVWLGARQE